MGRRTSADPDLLRQVTDRLASVLAAQRPRRAQVEPELLPPPPVEDADDVDLLTNDPTVERQGRRVFRRTHLAVICGVLLVGLLWAGWSVLRARPVAVAEPGGSLSISSPVPTPATRATAVPVRLVVHVLGAVRRPGLVTLPDGSRVQDAIKAAGGLTRTADPGELNLAQPLTDGEQIVIGTRRDPAGEVRDGGGTGSGSQTGGGGGGARATLDLNRATQAQLEELPGVGPVTAGKILAWRQEHRRFSRVEELQEVDGIGPKTYAQIAPHVRV